MAAMFKFFENLVDPYTEAHQLDVPPNKLISFMAYLLAPFRTLIIINFIAALGVAAMEVGLIYYLGRLVDLISVSTPQNFWQMHRTELILVVIFVIVFRPIVRIVEIALVKNAIQPNVAALGRWRSHKHVLQQPVGWFESDFAGRIANRVVQLSASAGDFIFQIIHGLTFAVAFVLGAAIVLANSHILLLAPLAIWLVGYVLFLRWALKKVRPAARASSAARSQTLGFVVDSYSNIQSVKLFSHDQREMDQAYNILENHRHTYMAENRIVTTMEGVLVVMNGFMICSIIGLSLYMWSTGSTSAGIIAAAGALSLRINAMSGWFMTTVSGVLQALGVISEGMESIAQPIHMTDQDNAKDLGKSDDGPVKGAIKIDEVSHHYGRETGGLFGVDLDIKPGEKVGLVGRSGAGKSTLVKTVLRLFDPENGRILIDGTDIKTVTQSSVRAHIGMVQQESSLLHRSIIENLRYGRPEASDEQVFAAARQAEAHDFILDLVDSHGNVGYDAQVGERGVKLSGGQRQRIALSRVILKDAPILILDEATSALDSEVEAQIQTTLYSMMKGKTVIAIAHRLSTIAEMDRIIVLDEGKVVEEGPHDELIAQGGLYASLWSRQSGGFIES